MRRIQSNEDDLRGVVTYELEGGKRVCLDARAVREHGAAAILRGAGYAPLLPTERLPVYQGGYRIGTLPPDFDPTCIKSNSFLYEPRPGDFRRAGDKWIAANTLGPGDFECIPGFSAESEG